MRKNAKPVSRLTKIDTKYPYSAWSYSIQTESPEKTLAIHVSWRPDRPHPATIPPWIENILPQIGTQAFKLFAGNEDYPWAPPAHLMFLSVELDSESSIWGVYAYACDNDGMCWTIDFDHSDFPNSLRIICYGGNHVGDSDLIQGLLTDDPLRQSKLLIDWYST